MPTSTILICTTIILLAGHTGLVYGLCMKLSVSAPEVVKGDQTWLTLAFSTTCRLLLRPCMGCVVTAQKTKIIQIVQRVYYSSTKLQLRMSTISDDRP